MIIKSKPNRDFTVMRNDVLERTDLSLKAKGLWAFLMTKPDGWRTSIAGLEAQLPEGRDAIMAALKELSAIGLYRKEMIHRPDGTFTWEDFVFDQPHTGFPYTDKPLTGKPYTENPRQVNTELVNTEKVKVSKDTTGRDKRDPGVQQVMEMFEREIGIQQPQTMRRYAYLLIRKYELEPLLVMITAAAAAQQVDRFCPRTPTVKDFFYQKEKLQDYFRRRTDLSAVDKVEF